MVNDVKSAEVDRPGRVARGLFVGVVCVFVVQVVGIWVKKRLNPSKGVDDASGGLKITIGKKHCLSMREYTE